MGTDDDDLLQTLVEQVQDALDTLRGEDGRDALLAGIKEALDEAGIDAPEVTIVQGGLDDEAETPSSSEGPDLRVVGDDEVEPSRPEVRVQTTVKKRPRSAPDPTRSGRIQLGGRAGDGPWQTVYRGTEPRLYRLLAETGGLEIAVDGMVVEALEPGQSLDIEGSLLRLRASDKRGAAGIYTLVK